MHRSCMRNCYQAQLLTDFSSFEMAAARRCRCINNSSIPVDGKPRCTTSRKDAQSAALQACNTVVLKNLSQRDCCDACSPISTPLRRSFLSCLPFRCFSPAPFLSKVSYIVFSRLASLAHTCIPIPIIVIISVPHFQPLAGLDLSTIVCRCATAPQTTWPSQQFGPLIRPLV